MHSRGGVRAVIGPTPAPLSMTLMQTFVGHARPLVNLAARLVRLRPVAVTLLTTDAFYDRIKNELARSFDTDEEELVSRIRLVLG